MRLVAALIADAAPAALLLHRLGRRGFQGQRSALGIAARNAAAIYNQMTQLDLDRDLASLQTGDALRPITINPLAARNRLQTSYAQLLTEGALSARVRDTATAAIVQAGEAISLLPVGVGEEFQDCPHCPVMVVVPAGHFAMGSPQGEKGRFDNEGPQHTVTVSHPFAISKFPVTMGELRAWQPARGPDPVDSGPAVMVTWADGGRYAAWLSDMTGRLYHLPTEAEYEYAERAGTTTSYPWGDAIGQNKQLLRLRQPLGRQG